MINSAIINTCDWGSTGKIACGLLDYLNSHRIETIFCYGRGSERRAKFYKFTTKWDIWFHYLDKILTGRLYSSSKYSTKRLIQKLRSCHVRNIYIINMHGCYLNAHIFYQYLIEDNVNVVYIMADESAFLGNCTYRNGCYNYMNNCIQCPKLGKFHKFIYPSAPNNAYIEKKNAYKAIKRIAFVAPEFVIKCSKDAPLLNEKKTIVVDEAVDVRINRPRDTFVLRESLGIDNDKIVIVCVAPYSYERKGVRFFIETARKMADDNRFVFVQVGFDSKDYSILPSNYIPIGYVNDQDLLTQYYSLADLFVFPSLQDTMPNACLEALACGSPLLCFNTSGMPYIADESVMTLVEPRNVNQMVNVILKTKKKNKQTIEICRNYALKRYDNKKYFEKLLNIMNNLNI